MVDQNNVIFATMVQPREAMGYCRGMPGCKMTTVVDSWIRALTAIGIFQELLCIVSEV